MNVAIAGQFNNTTMLASIGLGNVIIEVIGIGAYFGLTNSLCTLASQAIGAKQFHLCGVYY